MELLDTEMAVIPAKGILVSLFVFAKIVAPAANELKPQSLSKRLMSWIQA